MKQELNQTVDSYEQLPLPEDVRYFTLGFVFRTLAGEFHFAVIVKNAGKIKS